MPTEVLYRKWRPQRFADVSGQEVVKRTLVNALAGGKLSHAYLFSGPRGTGKTTMGRLLTKAINCEKNAQGLAERAGEPCNECPSCIEFNDGRSLDLIEMDGASNRGVEEIRKLRDSVGYMPMGGKEAHKVYLIDEVHMLTEVAFNALLKTLEEPPPHIVFILATTDVHKVPATIVSRCQRQDFKRIPLAATADRLAHIAEAEGMSVPREGLELVARSATGSLRDAINLLEQICDSYGKDASLEAVREGLGLVADERARDLATQVLHSDLPGALATIAAVRDDGLSLKQFQKETVQRLRELLLVEAGAAGESAWTPEQIADMRASINGVQHAMIVRALRLFSEADLRQDPLSPLPLELAAAEAMMAPAAASPANAPATANAPAPRPAAPPSRPAVPASRQAPPPATPVERVPVDLRKDNITGASAEEIARMVGSRAPVIPPASDAPDDVPPLPDHDGSPAADGAPPNVTTLIPGGGDGILDGFIERLRSEVKNSHKLGQKVAALLNGSCHAQSWEDGVLTIAFHMDAHHKKTFDTPEMRKIAEESAAKILDAPVSIRCIVAAKPARALSKSPLVQHAVETHGATIISRE